MVIWRERPEDRPRRCAREEGGRRGLVDGRGERGFEVGWTHLELVCCCWWGILDNVVHHRRQSVWQLVRRRGCLSCLRGVPSRTRTRWRVRLLLLLALVRDRPSQYVCVRRWARTMPGLNCGRPPCPQKMAGQHICDGGDDEDEKGRCCTPPFRPPLSVQKSHGQPDRLRNTNSCYDSKQRVTVIKENLWMTIDRKRNLKTSLITPCLP